MKIAKNTLKKLSQLRKKNWSAPAIISAFILTMMIIVYSFESIGLLNKERNLDMRLSNPESLIKTSYKDLKEIYSDKFDSHQINPTSEENAHLKKDFVLNKINIHSKKSKEIYIETINKILIEGAISQIRFERSVSSNNNNTQNDFGNFNNGNKNENFRKINNEKYYCGSPLDHFHKIKQTEKCGEIGETLKKYISMIENRNSAYYDDARKNKARKENENNDILYFDM